MSQIHKFKISKSGTLPASLLAAATVIILAEPAQSYPEFQQFVEKNSHRTVNCAMCHTNENGPVGNAKGQIGSLDELEMKHLGEARRALEPGQEVDSPILNKFGNQIIKAIGKKKVLEAKNAPMKLAEFLPKDEDLDGDGIPDSEEYLNGTDPLNKFHGEPGKLFIANLNRYKMHIVLAAIAIFCMNYGLIHLVKGVSILQEKKLKHDGERDSQNPPSLE